MAKINTCDGTGVEIPENTPETGHFHHQYSDAARPIAEAYLRELDEIHTETAQAMKIKVEVLRSRYRALLRELPDQ